MRTLFALVYFAGLLAGSALADPADPLAHLQKEHPRLLFTNSALAGALEAAKTDPLRAALHARIIAAAQADLKAPPIVHRLIGPRLLDQSRAAIKNILTCAMAYRLGGDARFLNRARSDLLTVSAFADWNPSHFLDIAEMSFAVGIGYDWLYKDLSAEDRAIIKRALLEKSLAFAPMAYQPKGKRDKRLFWVDARMNWNQVCNGGLLTAALALADEEPALARLVVEGVRKSLPLAMGAYQPDGAYPEGPGYWAYGTDYNVFVLAMLEGTLGDDFGLGAAPAFDKTALYRLVVQGPTGLGFNYADGGAKLEDAPAYTWLAMHYHIDAAVENSRALLTAEVAARSSDRFLALHAVWFPPAATQRASSAVSQLPLDTHFNGPADIALFRSAWNDPHALFLGFKAGSNTTNHAHLDLGSFVLDSDGVRWAVDLGPDNYNLPDYFGSKRWTYFRLNNHSHNTLTPGNALQNPKADARIVAFSSAPNRALAVADLTAVYPGQARRILRGVAMLDRARILIEDEVSGLKESTPLRWAMMTEAAITLSEDGKTALLSKSGHTLRAEALSPEGAKFEIASARPETPGENQNSGDSLLLLSSPPAASASNVTIAVVLTPVGDHWPKIAAPKITGLADWK